MVGTEQLRDVSASRLLLNEKLMHGSRKQSRHRPDQQNQAQRCHGSGRNIDPTHPSCNRKFRCHKGSHQRKDSIDVTLKVGGVPPFPVEVGKKRVVHHRTRP